MMSRLLFAVAMAATVAVTLAQNPQDSVPATAIAMMPASKVGDTIHVQTHIGSFKIVPKGHDAWPAGRLDFAFSGTVLVSQLAPGTFIKTSGKVRKEYEDKHGKTVYFGTGRILIVGKFHSCQWFGRNLDMAFKGDGVIRMNGEFDNNLDTGTYWFDGDRKEPLQTSLMSLPIPHPQGRGMRAITREDFEKQKKKGG